MIKTREIKTSIGKPLVRDNDKIVLSILESWDLSNLDEKDSGRILRLLNRLDLVYKDRVRKLQYKIYTSQERV